MRNLTFRKHDSKNLPLNPSRKMDEWSRFIQEINPTIRFLFDKHNKRVSKNKLKIAKEMVLGPLFNYQRKNVDFTSYF